MTNFLIAPFIKTHGLCVCNMCTHTLMNVVAPVAQENGQSDWCISWENGLTIRTTFIARCLQEHLKLMLHSISILPHQRWKACISCLSSHWGRSKLQTNTHDSWMWDWLINDHDQVTISSHFVTKHYTCGKTLNTSQHVQVALLAFKV